MPPFKFGDKVICIDNECVKNKLRINKVYTIYSIKPSEFTKDSWKIQVVGLRAFFTSKRFVKLDLKRIFKCQLARLQNG